MATTAAALHPPPAPRPRTPRRPARAADPRIYPSTAVRAPATAAAAAANATYAAATASAAPVACMPTAAVAPPPVLPRRRAAALDHLGPPRGYPCRQGRAKFGRWRTSSRRPGSDALSVLRPTAAKALAAAAAAVEVAAAPWRYCRRRARIAPAYRSSPDRARSQGTTSGRASRTIGTAATATCPSAGARRPRGSCSTVPAAATHPAAVGAARPVPARCASPSEARAPPEGSPPPRRSAACSCSRLAGRTRKGALRRWRAECSCRVQAR
mmetsp:Transcript_50347/g.145131  ORF Transcript_50347/g.145131 Transcript_50347/m.145131 type:complete len:269 (-) Transcript_50347:31-837(-)